MVAAVMPVRASISFAVYRRRSSSSAAGLSMCSAMTLSTAAGSNSNRLPRLPIGSGQAGWRAQALRTQA